MTKMEIYAKAIGLRLQELRNARDYSQNDIAKRLGVSKMLVSYWERAERDIYAYQVSEICRIYGITESEFYDGVNKYLPRSENK